RRAVQGASLAMKQVHLPNRPLDSLVGTKDNGLRIGNLRRVHRCATRQERNQSESGYSLHSVVTSIAGSGVRRLGAGSAVSGRRRFGTRKSIDRKSTRLNSSHEK